MKVKIRHQILKSIHITRGNHKGGNCRLHFRLEEIEEIEETFRFEDENDRHHEYEI